MSGFGGSKNLCLNCESYTGPPTSSPQQSLTIRDGRQTYPEVWGETPVEVGGFRIGSTGLQTLEGLKLVGASRLGSLHLPPPQSQSKLTEADWGCGRPSYHASLYCPSSIGSKNRGESAVGQGGYSRAFHDDRGQ